MINQNIFRIYFINLQNAQLFRNKLLITQSNKFKRLKVKFLLNFFHPSINLMNTYVAPYCIPYMS